MHIFSSIYTPSKVIMISWEITLAKIEKRFSMSLTGLLVLKESLRGNLLVRNFVPGMREGRWCDSWERDFTRYDDMLDAILWMCACVRG